MRACICACATPAASHNADNHAAARNIVSRFRLHQQHALQRDQWSGDVVIFIKNIILSKWNDITFHYPWRWRTGRSRERGFDPHHTFGFRCAVPAALRSVHSAGARRNLPADTRNGAGA
jgi:hypothetical protein